MQFGFEPVLKTASVSLGISEAEFIAIYQELQEGEWAEQLRLADQGVLHDIMSEKEKEKDELSDPELSEDQVIEVVEIIT